MIDSQQFIKWYIPFTNEYRVIRSTQIRSLLMHVKTKHPNTISKYRDTHIYTWLVCHSHLHLLLCCIWGLWSSSWQPTPSVIASNIYQLHGNDAISHNQSCLILFDKYQYLLMLSNKKLLNYVKDELLFWRLFWTKKIMLISFRRVDYGILSMYAVDTQWWVLMLSCSDIWVVIY